MKTIFATVTALIILSFPVYGNTMGTPEDAATSAIKSIIQSYTDRNDGQLPTKWSDLFRSPMELALIDQSIAPHSVSELYAFITGPQRDLFPDGKLLLIRVKESPWPDAWKTSTNIGGDSVGDLTRARSEEIERSRAHQKPIRYVIFQDKRGKIRSDWWYEEKIQEMLFQTGIIVPLPTPYRQRPPTPLSSTPVDASAPAAPAVAAQTVPTVAPATVPTPAPVAPQPAKSSNLLWWLLGAIATLVAVALVIRKKKKPKA